MEGLIFNLNQNAFGSSSLLNHRNLWVIHKWLLCAPKIELHTHHTSCYDRSGKTSDTAAPVISKKGKADLRYALYQAALIASIRNSRFMVYFTKKLQGRALEPRIKTKMRVKLAAKLMIIGFGLEIKALTQPSEVSYGLEVVKSHLF